MKTTVLLILLSFGINATLLAQVDNGALLTVDKLFENRFNAKSYGPVTWLEGTNSYTVLESSGNAREIIRYDVETGDRSVMVSSRRLVPPGQNSPLQINNYTFNVNQSHLLLYTNVQQHVRGGSPGDHSGDFWVLDLLLGTWHKLGGDAPAQSLRHAQFSPDGKKVSYIKGNNIYVENLRAFTTTQLTFDGTSRVKNGRNKSSNSSMVNAGLWGDLRSQPAINWSPDSEQILFVQSDWSHVPSFHMINNTETLYPRLVEFPYIKVGQKMESFKIGVVNISGGDIQWLDTSGDPYDNYQMQLDWKPSGNEIFKQVFNREQNTMKVYTDDLNGSLQHILTDTGDAWIEPKLIFWLDNGNRFIFTSEKEGWLKLYLHDAQGNELRRISPREVDVLDIHGIDEQNGWIYYIASPENATQRYLYRVSLDGRNVEKLTPDSMAGINRYDISPDLKWAIHTHSTLNSPPTIRLISLPDHNEARMLEDNQSLRKELEALSQGNTSFIKVDIGDGIVLDGYKITPPGMDPNKKYPLIYYIYGEPAGQTVLDNWFGRRHLWHLMLAQKGYVVMSIDNRGTPAPKGNHWRKAIYGQLGYVAANEHAAATRKVLETYPYIDGEHVGIYGHSGGGQMSLNLIFRYPELYNTAIASSFVSHQRFYHPAYQERFMGLPENNKEGYHKGSPITWTSGLDGNLMIIHGTADSNVHYQSFEALINELVANDKQFSMMSYPNREHGLMEGENTQIHLHRLRTNFFMQHLPPGPR